MRVRHSFPAMPDLRLRWLWTLRVDARQRCHWLLAWLFGLNIGDVITTQGALTGGGAELNPFMRGIVDNALHVTLVKVLCLVVVTALVLRTRSPERVAWALGAVNLWYALVVSWNVAIIARA